MVTMEAGINWAIIKYQVLCKVIWGIVSFNHHDNFAI